MPAGAPQTLLRAALARLWPRRDTRGTPRTGSHILTFVWALSFRFRICYLSLLRVQTLRQGILHLPQSPLPGPRPRHPCPLPQVCQTHVPGIPHTSPGMPHTRPRYATHTPRYATHMSQVYATHAPGMRLCVPVWPSPPSSPPSGRPQVCPGPDCTSQVRGMQGCPRHALGVPLSCPMYASDMPGAYP